MCDAALLVVCDLAQRSSVGWVIENRVVPESTGPLRALRNLAFDGAGGFKDDLTAAHHGQRANEPRAPLCLRHCREAPVDFRKPLWVGCVLPQEARRMHAWRTLERVNHQA